LEALGQKSNGSQLSGGKRFDRKKSLVLMRFNTGLSRGGFAEIQEASNLVPEICQRKVVAVPYGRPCRHVQHYIVIRCYLEWRLRSAAVRFGPQAPGPIIPQNVVLASLITCDCGVKTGH
jgi:hypothetical protein